MSFRVLSQNSPLETGRESYSAANHSSGVRLQKLCGPNDYLSFGKFPLSIAGEFSLRTHLLPDLKFPLTGDLRSECCRKSAGIVRILWHKLKSQISMIINTDISIDNQKGLNRMSMDIKKSIFGS